MKSTRTSHATIYDQLERVPEIQNIIVTERELGAMRKKMELQYKRIVPENELEAIVRAEKMVRLGMR